MTQTPASKPASTRSQRITLIIVCGIALAVGILFVIMAMRDSPHPERPGGSHRNLWHGD